MPEQRSNEVLKRFEFGVQVTKAWKNKETGKYYVRAIASDTGVDHHGERFSEKALEGMVNCIVKGEPAPVILLPTHWDTFEIGKAVDSRIIDSPTHAELKALEVDIELDMEYPQAKSLYKEVESGNAQKQLSVGGYLNPDSDEPYFWEEKEYEMEDGNKFYDYILVLNDIILDHIAVTRKDHAANPRTGFSEAIAKSLGLEKPQKPQNTINKEVQQMSKAEKQAESLANLIAKSIKEFFKSSAMEDEKVKEAKDALAKAKESLASLGDDIPAELQEELKSLVKSEETQEPAGEEAVAKQVEETKDEEAVKTSEETIAEAEKTSEKAPENTIDVEALKSSIVEEVTKSLNDSQQETFKEIAKSLGDVIAETIKSQVEPLQQKIAELEKFSGKSKSLQGQEDLEVKVSKSSNEDEEDNLWAGFIKSAIPGHILAEKLSEHEGGNE